MRPLSASDRDSLVELLRNGPDTDTGFTTKPGEPVKFAEEWAQFIPGTGQERREAAQEEASLVATFRMLANPETRSLTSLDFLGFMGAVWDITSAVKFGRDGIEVTATRRA